MTCAYFAGVIEQKGGAVRCTENTGLGAREQMDLTKIQLQIEMAAKTGCPDGEKQVQQDDEESVSKPQANGKPKTQKPKANGKNKRRGLQREGESPKTQTPFKSQIDTPSFSSTGMAVPTPSLITFL